MFWDPYFGWDTHMIRSCAFGLFMFSGLASFVCSTEGLGWDYPYVATYAWMLSHTDAVLISIILLLIGTFYFWKAQIGEF
jgi:hypothetical protein